VIVVDVNLLLYAVVTGFPQHAVARDWWEGAPDEPSEVGLAAPAIFGFLRIGTNPRVLNSLLPVAEAAAYVREWLNRPQVHFLRPGPRHLEIAFDLLRGLGTAANLTTDSQLAALAVENAAELASNDTDFGRFPRPHVAEPAPLTRASQPPGAPHEPPGGHEQQDRQHRVEAELNRLELPDPLRRLVVDIAGDDIVPAQAGQGVLLDTGAGVGKACRRTGGTEIARAYL
jgi:toxin-antitoxin system PIN domain toxin